MKFLTVFAAILAVAFGAQSHWTLDQLSEALESPHTKPTPVAPETPAISLSPLVQIILNINQQSVTPEAVVVPAPVGEGDSFINPRPPAPVDPRPPAPVITLPEIVLPTPEIQPTPVIVAPDYNPIDVIAVNPEPVNPIEVIAVSPPEVNPIEVIAVSPPEVNPIEVIAVSPPEVNPIEVIAVSPPEVNPIEAIAISPPEVNPVDLINPVIVPGVVIGGGDIGPM